MLTSRRFESRGRAIGNGKYFFRIVHLVMLSGATWVNSTKLARAEISRYWPTEVGPPVPRTSDPGLGGWVKVRG
jgi:hypothetical protein